MQFENLDVWKRSARLSAEIYRSLALLKDFGYKDQITRSGLSVASNIAEGYERESARDRVKFLNYAKGSCGELRSQIHIGMEAGCYIEQNLGKKWIAESQTISKMLYGLMRAIESKS